MFNRILVGLCALALALTSGCYAAGKLVGKAERDFNNATKQYDKGYRDGQEGIEP